MRQHQLRDEQARKDARTDAAERDLIRNDEVLEVDEGRGDKERNKYPVGDRDVPWEAAPDEQEHHRGEQLDEEVAESDARAAVRAAPAQMEPADQWQVVVPGDRCFAGRAEGALRLVDGKIERQAINDDVEKRADRCTEKKGEDGEDQIVDDERVHQLLVR